MKSQSLLFNSAVLYLLYHRSHMHTQRPTRLYPFSIASCRLSDLSLPRRSPCPLLQNRLFPLL